MGNFARRRRHPIAGADEGVVVVPPDGDWFRGYSFDGQLFGGAFHVEPASVNLSMAASASFDYDPFQYTHKMQWNWTAASNWGTPPDYVPRQIGFVTASGTSAASAVYSIPDNEHTKGIRINPSTGELYVWFDRELLNTCLGPTRTFDVTATVGATSRSTAVTVNLDISDYASSVGLTWNVPGISSRCGVDPATTLTPFPAYGGSYPSGWTVVENTYSSFVAGVYTTGLKWYEIRPTGNGSTLTDYDCSGFAFRNPSNYTNIEVTNCLFDGSVWGLSPLVSTYTVSLPVTAGSTGPFTLGTPTNGPGINSVVSDHPDIPAGTYVTARTLSGSNTTTVTLSQAATGTSTATTRFTNQQGGSSMCVIQIASASTATMTFTDCTFDMKGDVYHWFLNALESRHPNQSFINCKFIDFANDGANINGGTFTDCYFAGLSSNNWRADNSGVAYIPPGDEVNAGAYWGHSDGIQAFNANQNVTITRCYADLRWYHIDPLLEQMASGATAPFYMQENTSGTILVQNSISRGGVYGIYAAAVANANALTTFRDCLFDGDSNLGQVVTPRVQLQAENNKYLLDWIARDDASQPVGGGTLATSGAGIPTYYKGDDYGYRTNTALYHPTNYDYNPTIVAPASLSVAVAGPNYVRFSFTRQNNTTYEVRHRTTAGPGAWSSWADLDDQTFQLYMPGLSSATGYDFEVRGYNANCVKTSDGSRLIADGPAGSVSATTAAALGADADAAAIVAAWTTPATAYEEHAVYNLVAALKAGANVWNQLGHLFCACAGSTAAMNEQRSLFNWKSPSTTYTKASTPTWRGSYGGVSASGMGARYILSGWKPGYSGDTLALQNSNSFFRYMVATDGTPSNVVDIGNAFFGIAANNGTNMRFFNGSATSDAPTTSANPYLGMLLMSRDNSADYDVYFSVPSGTLAAISGSPITRTSGTPPNSELTFLAQNTNTAGGITISRSSRGYMAFEGGGLQMTVTQGQELQDAIEAFLDWFDALPA